jgi:hypothetical protein
VVPNVHPSVFWWRLSCAAVAGLVWLLALGGAGPSSAQAVDWPCDIRTSERVVAVGDAHGAYDAFVGILRTAGLVDRRDRWSGGRAVFIQTGDILDRGAQSRRIIDFLQRLERDAAKAGGAVYPLLGNHEFMRLAGDWRYVSTGELAAFRDADSTARRQQVFEVVAERERDRAAEEKRPYDARTYREQFMKEIPLGFLEMRVAFDAAGDYGKWVRSRAAMVKVNGIAFMHGGVSEEVAPLGCDGINDAMRRDMASLPVPAEKLLELLATKETGPLWYRGLANEPEEAFAPTLEGILAKIGARAIVVGHTPVLPGRIATRFGGRVIQLDSGMLDGEFFPGGVPSALELQGDVLTAIYPDRRERLAAPALVAATH